MRWLALILVLVSNALAQTAPEHSLFFTALHKDGSRPAPLSIADLEVTGVARVHGVEALPDVPIAYALLVDISGSRRPMYAAQNQIIAKILRTYVRSGVDSGMLSLFKEQTLHGKGMIDKPELLIEAARRSRLGGASALFDAVAETAERLHAQAPEGRPLVLFVLTDGQDNASRRSISDAIARLQAFNVRLYAFCMQDQRSSRNALLQMSEATGGQTFEVESIAQGGTFSKGISTLGPELRNWYRLKFTPYSGAGGSLSVRALHPGLRIRIQPLYSTENK